MCNYQNKTGTYFMIWTYPPRSGPRRLAQPRAFPNRGAWRSPAPLRTAALGAAPLGSNSSTEQFRLSSSTSFNMHIVNYGPGTHLGTLDCLVSDSSTEKTRPSSSTFSSMHIAHYGPGTHLGILIRSVPPPASLYL